MACIAYVACCLLKPNPGYRPFSFQFFLFATFFIFSLFTLIDLTKCKPHFPLNRWSLCNSHLWVVCSHAFSIPETLLNPLLGLHLRSARVSTKSSTIAAHTHTLWANIQSTRHASCPLDMPLFDILYTILQLSTVQARRRLHCQKLLPHR